MAYHRYPTYVVDEITRDRYGVDVPTLLKDNERLRASIHHRDRELDRRDREVKEYKLAYVRLKDKYITSQQRHEELKARFRELMARRWGYL